MNLMMSESMPTLHVVSLDSELTFVDAPELEDVPGYNLEDMGAGLDWGLDCAQNLAYQLGKECWVIEPTTGAVLYRINPAEITLH